MGLGVELVAFDVQVDFLVAKSERLACHRRCPADKGLELHLHDAGVEIHTGFFMGGGEDQMVKVVDHGARLATRVEWMRSGQGVQGYVVQLRQRIELSTGLCGKKCFQLPM